MLVSHRYRVEETTVFKQSARKPTSRPRRDTESPAPAEETTEEQEVALRQARQTIKVQKKEIESLKEKTVLGEDRNYLRQTLRDALCKPLGTEKHRYCRFEDAIGKVFSKFERQEEYRGL